MPSANQADRLDAIVVRNLGWKCGGAPAYVSGLFNWSRRSDLNRGPADYEASAGHNWCTRLDADGRLLQECRPCASTEFRQRPSVRGSVWGGALLRLHPARNSDLPEVPADRIHSPVLQRRKQRVACLVAPVSDLRTARSRTSKLEPCCARPCFVIRRQRGVARQGELYTGPCRASALLET